MHFVLQRLVAEIFAVEADSQWGAAKRSDKSGARRSAHGIGSRRKR